MLALNNNEFLIGSIVRRDYNPSNILKRFFSFRFKQVIRYFYNNSSF